ncbi:MAG: putative porin [Acidobacteriia bacterium]|nr:putative porin [Terriglobia bacterium]
MKMLVWFHVVVLAATLAAGQTSSKPKAAAKKATKTGSPSEIQLLRDALTAQQQQMEQQRQQMEQLKSQLQQLLDATQQANAAAQKGQSSADQAQTTAAQAQQSATEAQRLADQASANAVEAKTSLALVNRATQDESKRLSALSDLVGRFRLNGDIRIRGESIFQDFSGFQDRNRARVRVRFGLEGKLNEDFTAGFALATGTLGDPTTTNETFTNFFDRKTIGLDKGYITYNPVAHPWISATGGKFAYQWQRTAVTGDPDLNPEGFDVKLSFNTNNSVIKNVTVQAISYLFNEVTSGTDSYALGGQAQTRLQVGRWTATPSFLAVKWNNPSAILQASAFAVQSTNTGSPKTGPFVPGEGPGCASGSAGGPPLPAVPPCAFSPNGMTNAVILGPDGKTPRFWSGFFYTDFILNNQIKTGLERWPVNLVLEFEDNLDAADHPIDPDGKILRQFGSQNKAYEADISLGQLRNRNDLQFGYVWYRQEQDAVLSSFAESDQRAPTNILQNRVYALWKLRSNTVASFTWWHGRTLNSNLENSPALIQKTITKAGQVEPYLNRFQFELLYTF